MNALAPIIHKLDPLVRRLASEKDGEVVACVRAIGRQLGKAGLTFHDLADRLTAPEAPAHNNEVMVLTNYAAAVEWILATDCGERTSRDIAFVEDMVGILRRWPASPKQAAWIRGLVERLGGCFDE